MCAVLICRSRGVRIHPSARHSEFHTHTQSIWSYHQLSLPSLNLSQHISLPSSPLHVFFFIAPSLWAQWALPTGVWVHLSWVTYQWPDPRDKWCFSWSCHLQTGSSAGGGAHEPLLHPCSNVGQLDLAQCPCAAMSSCIQQLCLSKKTVLPSTLPWPVDLTVFQPPLQQCPLSLVARVDIDVPVRAENTQQSLSGWY